LSANGLLRCAVSRHTECPTLNVRTVANRSDDITQLLQKWQAGDGAALDKVLPWFYRELRAMAASSLARQVASTVEPTALVHDVLLRLIGTSGLQFSDRRDLFNMCARVMRNLLIDRARLAKTEKHGRQLERVDIVEVMNLPIPVDTDLEKLDAALIDLEHVDPTLAKIVELRYFAGLTVREVADIVEVDERTIYRDWALARQFLREHMET